MRPEKIAELIVSLPWKTDANGYAIIKRSHFVLFLAEGRTLAPGEVVHHKNECKRDDSLENLEVVTRAEHARIHANVKGGPITYTPELREKRRQQMTGNQHARGYQQTPEQRANSSESKRIRYQDPVARAKTSEAVREVWRKRREGLLPMPQRTIH